MNTFQDYIKTLGWKACSSCEKYCQAGKTFCIQDKNMDGIFWYYETDQFIIHIHDFFVKKEMMISSLPDMSPYVLFGSSYLKSANGECFNPYQALTANTMFVTKIDRTDFRFLLHANFPYLSVGVNFKEKMITEYLSCCLNAPHITVSNVFFDTQALVTKPLEKLATSILNCKMNSPAAEIYLEAKVKEWLSITLHTYLSQAKARQLSGADEKTIENVANYINDHYALDISQELLEKIAMMSGTKLKNVFRQKYHMSITEYIQRKRMNIAEILISTTALEIRDIAKSVGYTSHSRFTTLFKKYKGIYPREVRKLNSFTNDSSHVCTYKNNLPDNVLCKHT